MNDPVLTALVGLGGTLVGALIAVIVARHNRIHQMKLAALEKRLATHQEAYAFCHAFCQYLRHESKLPKIVDASERWWFRNCLYLSQKAREAFMSAFHAAAMFSHRPEIEEHSAEKNFNASQKATNIIEEAAETIVKESALPGFAPSEAGWVRGAKELLKGTR